MDFTQAWAWPQWTVLILMFLALSSEAVSHGKTKHDYSFPVGVVRFCMWMFILICGGFFS